MAILRCGAFELPLTRPLVMGIVNLTPDSFSGDGLAANLDLAVEQAREQLTPAPICWTSARSLRAQVPPRRRSKRSDDA